MAGDRPKVVANAVDTDLTEEPWAQGTVRPSVCPFCRGSPKLSSADSHRLNTFFYTQGGFTIARCRCDSTYSSMLPSRTCSACDQECACRHAIFAAVTTVRFMLIARSETRLRSRIFKRHKACKNSSCVTHARTAACVDQIDQAMATLAVGSHVHLKY